jgi:isoamylase
MLLGGDELGRTQGGNNNAYCQDNEISWFDWSKVDEPFNDFVRAAVALRREHPVFKRRRFFEGVPTGGPVTDIAWFTPAGKEMDDDAWRADRPGAVAVFLNGDGIPTPDALGERVLDDSFVLLFNAGPDTTSFKVPAGKWGKSWQRVIDTAEFPLPEDAAPIAGGSTLQLIGRSTVVLRRVPKE